MKRETRIIDEKRVKVYVDLLFNETNTYEQKEIFRRLKDLNNRLIKCIMDNQMKNDLKNCEVSK